MITRPAVFAAHDRHIGRQINGAVHATRYARHIIQIGITELHRFENLLRANFIGLTQTVKMIGIVFLRIHH